MYEYEPKLEEERQIRTYFQTSSDSMYESWSKVKVKVRERFRSWNEPCL
jgi:hypothetical protein